MKVTPKTFAKAKKDLPKLYKAEELIQLWKAGIESLGELADSLELLEVEYTDLGLITTKTRRKDKPSVDGEGGGGKAPPKPQQNVRVAG